MRIGLVVDGESEYYTLRSVLDKAATIPLVTAITPVFAPIPPLAAYPVIARVCGPRVDILADEGVDRIIVVLDLENRDDAPGDVARGIEAAIRAVSQRLGGTHLNVVLKHRQYENWLLGDLNALRAHPARFRVSRGLERAIEPGKADNVSGIDLMKRCVVGDYDKVKDSARIMEAAEPLRIAQNSRSFRRLLRCYGSTVYADQSCRAATVRQTSEQRQRSRSRRR